MDLVIARQTPVAEGLIAGRIVVEPLAGTMEAVVLKQVPARIKH